MTVQEAINELKALEDAGDDKEYVHLDADKVLLRFLRAKGFADVADAWEALEEYCGGFWYA